MKKPLKLASFYTRTTFLLTVVTTIVVASLLMLTEYINYSKQKKAFRENYIEEQKENIKKLTKSQLDYVFSEKEDLDRQIKEELQSLVYQAADLAQQLYKKYEGVLSEAERKKTIVSVLESLQGVDSYSKIYITSFDGEGVAYYKHHAFRGANLIDLQDENGNYVVKAELNLLKERDEGFIHYPKNPDVSDSKEKYAFVKKSKIYDWYFSSDIDIEKYYDALKNELLQRISNVRFINGGYVFVNTVDGRPLVYNGELYSGNFNFFDGSDAYKKDIFQLERKAAKSSTEGGYFYYQWNKMGDTIRVDKCSYALIFDDWDWIIGSGFYLDEADSEIYKVFKVKYKDFVLRILQLLFVLVIILVFEIYLLNRFNRKIFSDFKTFFDFLRNAANSNEKLNENNFFFKEFRDTAIAANKMVSTKEKIFNDLVVQQEKAMESDRLKSAFLANMSHEIRTPMNAIIGFSELLSFDDYTAEEQKSYINLILNNGEKLMDLISDIIDLSKIEANQLEINTREFKLFNFVENSFERNKAILHQLMNQNVEFKLINTIDPSVVFFNDPVRINQIIDNLLSNAFKFTDSGVISYRAKFDGSVLEIVISDTGIGVSEKDLEHIFKRFRQVANELYREHSGTGLGLAITKNLVTMLKGTITVQSEMGKGTQFTVKIPSASF